MVRIPSLSRHSEPASTPTPPRDENRDGRIDARDETPTTGDTTPTTGDTTVKAGDTTVTDAGSTRTAPRTDPVRADDDGVTKSPTQRARSAVAERDTTTRPAPPGTPETNHGSDTDRRPEAEHGLGERTPRTEERPEVVVPAGPRPRASMLATLSLIFGVAAAGFVLTGALAGYGIALGTIALLLGVSGVSATARRHVAGKSDALIGICLGIGAVVVGVLAMTGQFDWPTTDGDTVVRFREWLDSQFVDRF
ncbi:DUF308 domain-containing protein [Plantactinospora soyae]|uniref:Thrombospondin n=1 Tax=Plantactinospora soyae TaxID=1544732 RepID=A0A927R567_9ACTN|nr:UbiA family prenyltransferase [Plantactinospora soyae]MBE1487214.1 hypothetical protein [Plantactinospora soyae]